MNRKCIYAIISIVFMSYLVQDATDQTFEKDLEAYQNKITNVVYSVHDNMHEVVMQFEREPVCFYAPVTFAESQTQGYKRYLLPRTVAATKEVTEALQALVAMQAPSFYFEIIRLQAEWPGYEIVVVADSSCEIEKVVDSKSYAVYFKIRVKN